MSGTHTIRVLPFSIDILQANSDSVLLRSHESGASFIQDGFSAEPTAAIKTGHYSLIIRWYSLSHGIMKTVMSLAVLQTVLNCCNTLLIHCDPRV